MSFSYKISQNKYWYLEEGPQDAPVMLLLHGYADTAKMFTYFIEEIKNKYKIFALDLPTVHDTTRVFSLNYLVDYIDDFVKHSGIENFTLLGYSSGGLIALNYSHKFPSKVKNLIMASSIPCVFSKRRRFILRHLVPLLKYQRLLKMVAIINANDVYRYIFHLPKLNLKSYQQLMNNYASIFPTALHLVLKDQTKQFIELNIPKIMFLAKDDNILSSNEIEIINNSHLSKYIYTIPNGGHGDTKSYWKKMAIFINKI